MRHELQQINLFPFTVRLLSRDEIEQEGKTLINDLKANMAGYDIDEYFHVFSLENYDRLLVVQDEYGAYRAILGVNLSYVCQEIPVLFLTTGFITDNTQGNGLMRWMIRKILDVLHQEGKFKPDFLVARTYNPCWYLMMKKLSCEIPGSCFYPEMVANGQCPEMSLIANNLIKCTNPGMLFDSQKGILLDGLKKTPNLFRGNRPQCRDEKINSFFDTINPLDLIVTVLNLKSVK